MKVFLEHNHGLPVRMIGMGIELRYVLELMDGALAPRLSGRGFSYAVTYAMRGMFEESRPRGALYIFKRKERGDSRHES